MSKTALPEAVKRVLGTRYPDANVGLVEEVRRRDQVVLYEVMMTSARRDRIEVLFAPTGEVTAERRA